jgi:hypothetical protein
VWNCSRRRYGATSHACLEYHRLLRRCERLSPLPSPSSPVACLTHVLGVVVVVVCTQISPRRHPIQLIRTQPCNISAPTASPLALYASWSSLSSRRAAPHDVARRCAREHIHVFGLPRIQIRVYKCFCALQMSLYKSFDAYDDVMSMRNPPVHGPRFTQERSVRSIAVILSFPFRFRRARRGRGESQSVRRGKGQSRKRRKSARCRGHPDDPLRSPPSPIMSAQPDHHLSLATVAAFSRLSQRNHKQRGGATRCVKAAAQRCCHGEFPAICINPKSSPFPSRRQGHSGATASSMPAHACFVLGEVLAQSV